MENKGQMQVAFAAIDPYLQQNIVSPTEKKVSGKDMVEWGDRNQYPEYLNELSETTPSLRTIIAGSADFVQGNGARFNFTAENAPSGQFIRGIVNTKGETIAAQIHDLGWGYFKTGGFALQVIRDKRGRIAETYFIDLRFLRSNEDNTVFYYSEKWAKAGAKKVLVYPAYQTITPERWAQLGDEERNRHASSIHFYKNDRGRTYPFPLYGAAVKACEIERGIDDFHLNSLDNSFTSSMIVNFNNGTPSDEQKKEIEKSVNEKFSGHQNAGRIMLSWNPDVKAQTTITSPKVEDFGARYDALSKHCRQQIFTAFRANPNLFGIPTENNGFSSEEYESAFRLYNRTVIRPVQAAICDAYDHIFGIPGVLTIDPFSLEESQANEQNVN